MIDTLEQDPQRGTPLGQNCYKIRIAIESKSKGKSSGARIITCCLIIKQIVYLLTIYDKSEKDDLTDLELKELISLLI